MSAHAASPSSNPRRSRRNQKNMGNVNQNDMIPTDVGDAQTFSGTSPAPSYPIKILRREDACPAPPHNNFLTSPSNQITPTRPRSMYDPRSIYEGPGHTSRGSTPDVNRRKKGGTKQSHQKITNVPGTSTNDTLLSSTRPVTLTPGRASETPSKAYAGPTFHASPAASSLPRPKFMSRSVPNVDKTTSLKKMLEQDGLEGTSESEGSPPLDNAQPVLEHQAREDSPLDIFFQADRDAKARALSQTNEQSARQAPQNQRPRELSDTRLNPVRNLSRHHTGNSSGGMFTLEMEETGQEHIHRLPAAFKTSNSSLDNSRATSDPIPPANGQTQEEQRIALTTALKKLVQSPRPQPKTSYSSPSPSPIPRVPLEDLGSPSPKPKSTPKNRAPARNIFGPPLISPGAGPMSHDQRQAALLALAEKQIATTNSSTGQRPPSSGLRKETSFHEPPKTPTPSRRKDSRPNLPDPAHANPTNGHTSSPFPIGLSNCSPKWSDNATDSDAGGFKLTMENDLRRILNLDILDGSGVTGVHPQ